MAPTASSVGPDVLMAEDFLDTLYIRAPRGYLTLLRRDKGKVKVSDFLDIRSVPTDQAALRACAIAIEHDVYFGVGLQGEKLDDGRRGDADSVIVIPGFWADVDLKHPAHKEQNLPANKEAAMLLLCAGDIEPSVVVSTGHGYHGYYLFESPLLIDEGNRSRVKALSAKLHAMRVAVARQHGWKIDNTSDLARIMRVAGTVNWKDEADPKLVTFEADGPRYELEEIERLLQRASSTVAAGFDGFGGFAADPIGEQRHNSKATVPPSPTESAGIGGFDGFVAGATPATKQKICASEDGTNGSVYSEEGSVGFGGFVPGTGSQKTNDGPPPPDGGASRFPPADIAPIMAGCAWMRHCRDDAAVLPEPEWYAMLGTVGRCRDGEKLAHELSRPYPKYTAEETGKKLQHALTAAGPTTCLHVLTKLNGHRFCTTCQHLNRITAPITLGGPAYAPSAESTVAGDFPAGTEAASGDPIIDDDTASGGASGSDSGGDSGGDAAGDSTAGGESSADKQSTASGEPPWGQPKTLETTLPPVDQLDVDLLPGCFRDHVADVSELMQVPPDFPAAALIVGYSGVVGRRAQICPKRLDRSFVVVPNLWGGIVARPGLMKSPTIRCVLLPLTKIQEEALEAHKQAMKDYAREVEAWELRKAEWKKKAQKNYDGESVFEGEKPEKPPCERFLVNDATVEKLHEILTENPSGVLYLRDELAGWFATLDSKSREKDRPFLLEAWNGDGSFTMDRIGRGTVHARNVCVSVFGGIQPAKLQAYLRHAVDGGPDDDGLAQRLQFLVWPDPPLEWRNVDREPDHRAAAAVEQVFRRAVELNSAEPSIAHFSADAQDLFDAWRAELELRLRRGRLKAAMESHLAKYRKLMPALALLLYLADSDGRHGQEVPLVHAQNAAALCEYLETHANRMYAAPTAADEKSAAALGEKIKKGRLGKKFTGREVYHHCWSGLSTPDEVEAAIKILEEAGWIRGVDVPPGQKGGRRTVMYLVNPAVYRA